MTKTVTQKYMITIMAFMIGAGAFNAIAYKVQNKQYVFEGVYFKQFFHPYMQATTMFFGQFLSLLLFLYARARNPSKFKIREERAKNEGKIVKFNRFVILIPAFADFITSTLHYTALNFIPGSIYQMMRGSTVITTMIFSILFLDKKLKRHQVVGCIIVLSGILTVAFSNLFFAKYQTEYEIDVTLQAFGYILVLALSFSHAFIFVFEQVLMDKYHIQPLELVGYQGLFGLLIEMICLPIISYIPCNFGITACVFTTQAKPYLEVPSTYFSEILSSSVLIVFTIIGIFSISLSNVAGVNVTKHISALTRATCDVTRVIVIWTVGTIITVTLGQNHPNYRWELVSFKSISVELFGLAILVSGNFIYNGFIKLPCLYRVSKQQIVAEKSENDKQEAQAQDEDGFKTDKKIYEDDLSLIL